MALTNTTVLNAKPKDRLFKLYDAKGLYLEVTPAGAKRWRFKYRRPATGKENRLSFGIYPDVSLKKARDERNKARELLAQRIDPGEARKDAKLLDAQLAANSFEAVARMWFERHLSTKAVSHRDKVVRRLERDVFPYIGNRPVAELKAPEILNVARRIERRGVPETAHRAVQNIGQVLRYAIANGLAEDDPTPALRGALLPVKGSHMAAPTDPVEVGAMLRACDSFKGGPVVAAAIRLLPLLFVRPGELRTMRWEHLDLEAAKWRFTTSKTRTEHLVPLSHQAVAILEDLRPLTGHLPGGWVFIGGRSPRHPMSDGAINAAYHRLGIDTKNELTGHGWRAVARTLLSERLNYPPEVIEQQLAHAVPDTLGRAYNRTKFLPQREKMMQDWADYLEVQKNGAVVVPLARAKK